MRKKQPRKGQIKLREGHFLGKKKPGGWQGARKYNNVTEKEAWLACAGLVLEEPDYDWFQLYGDQKLAKMYNLFVCQQFFEKFCVHPSTSSNTAIDKKMCVMFLF